MKMDENEISKVNLFSRIQREKYSIINIITEPQFTSEDHKLAKKCFDSKKLASFEDPDFVVTATALCIYNVKKSLANIERDSEGLILRKAFPEGIKQLDDIADLIGKENRGDILINKIVFSGPGKKIELNPIAVSFLKDIILHEWATGERQDNFEQGWLDAMNQQTPLGRQLYNLHHNTAKQQTTRLRENVAYLLADFLKKVSSAKGIYKQVNKPIIQIMTTMGLLNPDVKSATVDKLITRGGKSLA